MFLEELKTWKLQCGAKHIVKLKKSFLKLYF